MRIHWLGIMAVRPITAARNSVGGGAPSGESRDADASHPLMTAFKPFRLSLGTAALHQTRP